MDASEIEYRLAAHREILILLLTELSHEKRNRVVTSMSDETVFLDHEEDPGILPSPSYAYENARSAEIQLILEALEARTRSPI